MRSGLLPCEAIHAVAVHSDRSCSRAARRAPSSWRRSVCPSANRSLIRSTSRARRSSRSGPSRRTQAEIEQDALVLDAEQVERSIAGDQGGELFAARSWLALLGALGDDPERERQFHADPEDEEGDEGAPATS